MTAITEVLRPFKLPEPTCATCPCVRREGAQMACLRNPPQLTIIMVPAPPPHVGRLMPEPISGFPNVNERMVCWEHPAMQAQMGRAVEAAAARANVAADETAA